MIKNYNKYVLIVLLSVLFSCGDDPIEFKEQLIEWRKTHKEENQEKEDSQDNTDSEDTNDTTETSETDTKKETNTPKPSETDVNSTNKPSNNEGTTTNTTVPETPKVNEDLEVIHYNFDKWKRVNGKQYSVPVMNDNEDTDNSYWVSASNFGYAYSVAPSNKYPVSELNPSKNGSGIRIETKEKMGNLVGGSIYIGHIYQKSFIVKRNPARFGRKFSKEPVKLQFFYQYQSGSKKTYPKNLRKDQGEVKAILYEVTENHNFYLDKYTVKNHDYKVLEVREALNPTNSWTEKTLKFKVVNKNRYANLDFKNKKYRLTIIFNSSIGGGKNTGIVGSVLKIDDVSLYTKKN